MMSEKQKMVAGENYRSMDPELVAERLACRRLLAEYNASDAGDEDNRHRILRQLLGAGGDLAWIEPSFQCDYGKNIRVGGGFYANFNCVILDPAPVDIGENVMLGPGVHIYTATHPLDARERTSGVESARPVRIGHRVWLGGSVIVLPGVSIGDDTTVAAGSLVTRDLPAGVLAMGNPCRIIRSL